MAAHATSLTDFVTLGRSGLRVSPFCLGTMTFGTDWGWGSEPEDAQRIMDRYIEAGGNFIDTANIYTKGHSEVIIGDHIGQHAARRDRLVLATKFMGNMYPGDPNGGGAGRKSIIAACEESLRRLRTDYIDLYWMHFPDRHTPIEETMRALDDLVSSGKVRYIGLSDTPAWQCVKAWYEAHSQGWTMPVALQIEYSLAQRTVEFELLPMAREMGMGVTPWSPLKYGILTGKHTKSNASDANRGSVEAHLTERNLGIIEEVKRVANEIGCSCAQVALRWVQHQHGVASTIIGARTLEQLEDNIAALGVELADGHLEALDACSAVEVPFPQSFVPNLTNTIQGGATINGVRSEAWSMAPASAEERW